VLVKKCSVDRTSILFEAMLQKSHVMGSARAFLLA
jgi:hypothetical protein